MTTTLELALRPHCPLRLRPLLLLLTAASVTIAARPARADNNLLAGRRPSTSSGVSNSRALTDGAGAFEGEEWNTSVAALFSSDRAYAEFDLGASVPITAAYLQGDNNDAYDVSVSEDHTNFVPLWTAEPRPEAGLRERWTDRLSGHGRWVRLTVRGGDSAYSVSELQLFSQRPAVMPPLLRRIAGESQAAWVRSSLLYLIAAFGLFLIVTQGRSRRWQVALAALLPLAALAAVIDAIATGWPVAGREVAFFRAAAAAIALGAAIRVAVPGKRWPANRWAVTAALVISAAMAFSAFYNLGRPQFWNHQDNRPEFVHTNDLRVYQPFAKYFKELGYDGVYLASVMAYAEDRRGGSLTSLGMQEVRSLGDHRLRRVHEIENEIRSVRDRFSEARWAEFKKDMNFFEDVMGPEYLSTLTDHGANATPVWVFFGRLLMAHAPASEGLLVATGLVDGILLLLMAVALWRAFGLWPMLLAMTVFGANDLYMFGTNWSGATLRHDWLAFLGLGAAALKRERWTLAGVFLALSALIRAFPVVALLGVTLPALWSFGERWWRDRRRPALGPWLRDQGATVRVLVSAGVTVVVMVGLTAALYSPGAWVSWFHKVTLLNRDVGVNEISLRALVAGADNAAGAVLQARIVIFVVLEILCIGCVAWLARRRPLHQAMVLAMPLVLVISNPSNYYSHFVFLLALLADAGIARSGETAFASPIAPASAGAGPIPLVVPFQRVAAPLLALCIGGYWASLDSDLDRHFQDSTLLIFIAFVWLYVNLLRADPATTSFLAAEPSTSP
ncbi:MAG TPA: hypothetical protein VH853_07960 [Polyangia bacterium]|nr:hypothetical protein [Polyangia bacterium]